MNSLSPWVRKLAAIGLLVGVLALLWGAVLAPLRRWSLSSIETMNDAKFELVRVITAVEAGKHLSAEKIDGIEQAVASYVVPGGNEAEAITQAQAQVDRLLKEQGVALESIQAGTPQPAGPLRKISLDLRANGTEPKVVAFLAAAEQAKPILRVDRLILRGANNGLPDQARAGARIAVEATVSAYWRPQPVRTVQ